MFLHVHWKIFYGVTILYHKKRNNIQSIAISVCCHSFTPLEKSARTNIKMILTLVRICWKTAIWPLLKCDLLENSRYQIFVLKYIFIVKKKKKWQKLNYQVVLCFTWELLTFCHPQSNNVTISQMTFYAFLCFTDIVRNDSISCGEIWVKSNKRFKNEDPTPVLHSPHFTLLALLINK